MRKNMEGLTAEEEIPYGWVNDGRGGMVYRTPPGREPDKKVKWKKVKPPSDSIFVSCLKWLGIFWGMWFCGVMIPIGVILWLILM